MCFRAMPYFLKKAYYNQCHRHYWHYSLCNRKQREQHSRTEGPSYPPSNRPLYFIKLEMLILSIQECMAIYAGIPGELRISGQFFLSKSSCIERKILRKKTQCSWTFKLIPSLFIYTLPLSSPFNSKRCTSIFTSSALYVVGIHF